MGCVPEYDAAFENSRLAVSILLAGRATLEVFWRTALLESRWYAHDTTGERRTPAGGRPAAGAVTITCSVSVRVVPVTTVPLCPTGSGSLSLPAIRYVCAIEF